MTRYQAEGEGAFEPRSRRPRTSPTAISDDTIDLHCCGAVQGWVVGRAVDPAWPDDADPRAGQDADGVRVVRTDRIDATGKVTLRHAGRLYHIGIGREHARTHVLLLVKDLHVRAINAATGELTLDPARNYQPTGRPRRPKPKTP